jgi:hypothetical protein
MDDALACHQTSAERARAVREAALRADVSVRTIYRYLDRYRARGIRGLARTPPSNAGKPRVCVSRWFDKAWLACGDAATLEVIAAELIRAIKGL